VSPSVSDGVPSAVQHAVWCDQEEIFGPILPIIAVRSIDDAIEFVNDRPQPLALYVFTNSSVRRNSVPFSLVLAKQWNNFNASLRVIPQKISERVLNSTTSGGACVNDTVMHTVNPFMPFGGAVCVLARDPSMG
jgi:aldehyde dehydrogenase (NAD+)